MVAARTCGAVRARVFYPRVARARGDRTFDYSEKKCVQLLPGIQRNSSDIIRTTRVEGTIKPR